MWRGVRQGRSVLRQGGCCGWRWDRLWGASPEQAAARVIGHLGMRVEEFVFERLHLVIVELELQLEGAISDPSALP